MSITEVLHAIHAEGIEIEVYEALSKWLIENRAAWIKEAGREEATLNALEGIINLCDVDE